MNILVLGGSYFLGKHFVEMAHKEHTLTVFNRGSHPLDMEDVTELVRYRRHFPGWMDCHLMPW